MLRITNYLEKKKEDCAGAVATLEKHKIPNIIDYKEGEGYYVSRLDMEESDIGE